MRADASTATARRFAVATVAAVALGACTSTPGTVSLRPLRGAAAGEVVWGEHTVASRLGQVGRSARLRWKGAFDGAGVAYPGRRVVLVAYKRERVVEVYASAAPGRLDYVRSFPVSAASGGPGPKLREGDRQVPEGVYSVVALNPNSAFHLSLRLGYPNEFDRAIAEGDGRERLGGDIMIHGGDRSIGCIAVGDEAAEDLFVLAADAGIDNLEVVIVPRDFRRTGERETLPGQPSWVNSLYSMLDNRLRTLPPASPGAPRAVASSAAPR